jgi:hypothetical protein
MLLMVKWKGLLYQTDEGSDLLRFKRLFAMEFISLTVFSG